MGLRYCCVGALTLFIPFSLSSAGHFLYYPLFVAFAAN